MVMKKLLFFVLLLSVQVLPQGKIYFVFGSDTGIWEGMGTSQIVDHYDISLFTNPSMNANKVMDPAFRNPMRDKHNQPLKMTWWMMAGNIFRYADNVNVPINNLMTLYLMKKIYGNDAAINGDELTLHYHTFDYYDWDGDGKPQWNQAQNFLDCKEDFDFTLAQFLLEEKNFPVSFRSGWHYMDNEWQMYLNKILPYSLHNAGYKGNDTIEPIGNVIDWSLAEKRFIPYKPLDTNYQLPGGTGGWNVRSEYMVTAGKQTFINDIFLKAKNGLNQVVCLWAHLPQDDFLTAIQKLDSLIHKSAILYPTVDYSYCTAVEAYQKYLNGIDTVKPEITLTEIPQGENVVFKITSNEEIFQEVPFTSVKTTFNDYKILNTNLTGVNEWTTEPIQRKLLAKVGTVVCDTLGNQSMIVNKYLPDDIYVDNKSFDYIEQAGVWTTINNVDNWEQNSRNSTSDSASIKIMLNIPESNYYSLSLVSPVTISNGSTCYFYSNNVIVDTIALPDTIKKGTWTFITNLYLDKTKNNFIKINKKGVGTIGFDVLRISALVPDDYLFTPSAKISTGSFIERDTVPYTIPFENRGKNNLVINNISFSNGLFNYSGTLPIPLEVGQRLKLNLTFYSESIGEFKDTLMVTTSDGSILKIVFMGDVKMYFREVDNDEVNSYVETGTWAKSVVQAYGTSSRYSLLGSVLTATATFKTRLRETAYYRVSEIVPTTVNAVNAIYKLKINGRIIDSKVVDQNSGSGAWVPIFENMLPADSLIEVVVSYAGTTPNSNVLRADAIQFQKLGNTVSVGNKDKLVITEYNLEQNYPNPFNPSTVIRYAVPELSNINLEVYSINGERILSSYLGEKNMGVYEHQINLSNLASGVYVYMIKFVDNYGNIKILNKKMMLLK